MRLKRNRLQKCSHYKAIPKKDGEGNSYTEYGSPSPFLAETWPGGGRLQAEMYGIRLPGIRNLRLQGEYRESTGPTGKMEYVMNSDFSVTVNDGISLEDGGEKPDYRVVAVYPYRFLTLEVEKI